MSTGSICHLKSANHYDNFHMQYLMAYIIPRRTWHSSKWSQQLISTLRQYHEILVHESCAHVGPISKYIQFPSIDKFVIDCSKRRYKEVYTPFKESKVFLQGVPPGKKKVKLIQWTTYTPWSITPQICLS